MYFHLRIFSICFAWDVYSIESVRARIPTDACAGFQKDMCFCNSNFLYKRFFENTCVFLHEFDRDSSKKHVFTVNLCFGTLQVIFLHDLLDVDGCFMTVKRLLFTRGCGDGYYEKYVLI